MAKPFAMPSTAALDELAMRLKMDPLRPLDIGEVGKDEHGDQSVMSEALDLGAILQANEATTKMRVLHAQELVRRGVYGLCEDCGKKIPMARMEAIPYANRCVGCEEKA